jgi:hypothetical protein
MNVPGDEENGEPRASRKPDRARLLGIALLAAAVLFCAPALALGREVIRRYRRFVDPRDWFGNGRR